jgi:hypothetical protein
LNAKQKTQQISEWVEVEVVKGHGVAEGQGWTAVPRFEDPELESLSGISEEVLDPVDEHRLILLPLWHQAND